MVLLTACGSPDPSFLPLDQLCPTVAEQICDARQRCGCSKESSDHCQEGIRSTCETELAAITQDASLVYDSVRADGVRDDLQAALSDCKDPFPLARFFEHVKNEGETCERDTQCESQSCDPDGQHCTAVQGVALCGDREL
jgi:hypothetical protein